MNKNLLDLSPPRVTREDTRERAQKSDKQPTGEVAVNNLKLDRTLDLGVGSRDIHRNSYQPIRSRYSFWDRGRCALANRVYRLRELSKY